MWDRELKLHGEVKLVDVFEPVQSKEAKREDFARNLEKRPHSKF